MYSLPAYGQMVGHGARFRGYRNALERAVSSDSVVLDLGAGPGIFALLAAKAGAKKVYAVETDASIEWLRPLLKDNGLEGKVEVLRARSTAVRLAEPADVLISDLRGVLPFYGGHIPSLVDARNRLLRPDAAMIGRQDTIWASPVTSPTWYKRQVGGFGDVALADGTELNLECLHRAASNHWCRADLTLEECPVEPKVLGHLDYRTVTSPHFRAGAEWRFSSTTVVHGLALWFDTELDDHERLSNRPSDQAPLYGQAFFPWARPLDLQAGDRLEVGFDALLMAEDYVFRWRARQLRGSNSGEQTVAEQNQSTFLGAAVGRADLPSPR